MRQRRFARELGLVALLGGVISVGCGLFGSEKDEGDAGNDAGSGGTAGDLVTGGTAGTSFGGAAGTGISGGAGMGGSVTGGAGGMGGSVSAGAAGLGAAGSGGSGEMPPIGDIAWDATGYIDKGMNTFGVNGSWFSYNDCTDAMAQSLPCTMPDTTLLGPDGKMGWVTTPAQVCMKGTAAQVMMRPDGGTVDYFGIQWGAGMAFDLNNAGAGATAMPFNATAAGIAGFIFDITGTAPMTVRINYVMPTTESTSHFYQVMPAKDISVDFISVNQGSWVLEADRVAFDPTQLRTIQFQVFTNDMTPTPYDFCVSNVRVIRVPM